MYNRNPVAWIALPMFHSYSHRRSGVSASHEPSQMVRCGLWQSSLTSVRSDDMGCCMIFGRIVAPYFPSIIALIAITISGSPSTSNNTALPHPHEQLIETWLV